MDVQIGLSEKGREESVKAIRRVLAETYALYAKTHSYHWNVTGPRFHSLHNMFEEQYRDLWTAMDDLAERIRALGHFAPISSEDMMQGAEIRADNGVPDAETMIGNLARGHEVLSKACKDGIKVAESHGDEVTVDMLIARADASEKTAWMLRSSL